MNHGVLLVSLDFELFWGVRDKRQLSDYSVNLAGVRAAIPQILRLFAEYGIHGTWATVGMLYCADREEALRYAPSVRPNYTDKSLCPYRYLEASKQLDNACHFAPSIIAKIAESVHQEIATHTFSHFYCLEPGQSVASFRADLEASIRIAETRGIATKSIVFPRNQWNPDYLAVLADMGITSYRGNEESWLFRANRSDTQGYVRRLGRLIDAHINLTGHHTYKPISRVDSLPYNFPSSRFLRPVSHSWRLPKKTRAIRIKTAMRRAANHNEVFHLWWHPHNFGVDLDSNLEFLSSVLDEYSALKRNHGMKSMTMSELAGVLDNDA
jgi:peptidoglycan/xylan/chitin deacetylase (PgdA/CDA1 family)